MEKKKIRTKINLEYTSPKGTNVQTNHYIRGRVHGFMTALCGDEKHYGNGVLTNEEGEVIGYVMKTYATDEQYEQFKQLVEQQYPGLCEFDIMNK